MKEFIEVCKGIEREIERAVLMAIDNPNVNEYFYEVYGAKAEDNTYECIIDYLKERKF